MRAVRDREELTELGLPVWARWVRVRGATKTAPGEIDGPVEVGGATITAGEAVVLDADGAVVVPQASATEVVEAARRRAPEERVKRERLESGELSYDIDGPRAIVEGESDAPASRA